MWRLTSITAAGEKTNNTTGLRPSKRGKTRFCVGIRGLFEARRDVGECSSAVEGRVYPSAVGTGADTVVHLTIFLSSVNKYLLTIAATERVSADTAITTTTRMK